MTRKIPALIGAGVIAVAAAALATLAGAADSQPLDGRRVRLVPPPTWSFNGTFAGRELLLVDTLRSEVVRYSRTGERLGALPELATTKPAIVEALGRRALLIEDDDGYFAELDGASYRPRREWNLSDLARSSKGHLRNIYDWVALDERTIFLVGDIQQGDRWTTAFVRLSLLQPGDFQVLTTMEVTSPERNAYRTGYRYIASLDGEPYYVMMSENPHIVTPDGVKIRIARGRGTERRLLERAELPELRGAQAVRGFYASFEESTLPAGLYGWQGHLYLVMHTSRPGGATWSVLKVDPEEGRMVWHRPIATSAEHLTIIPGAEEWAFVEKGPVKGLGQQLVESVLFVPSREF